jgi:hypothetical protein
MEPTMKPTMKERFPLEHRRGDEHAYVREYESKRVQEYESTREEKKQKRFEWISARVETS